ncbi:1-acyl-sn-glycerol-3-phosphate acyltransferase [Anaeromyxobacter oryzisoli]|uniref:1-acyl-sn-glycerol-3-phosphate acyltransferase n=1 Tax=Anaeromyxobacter oryzisoli TaxID=2925408 RepID=UPI001F56A526|nr:1-acyl-sn-glycerol-3-phosphate acyltransferase [Anaeromyxobacter sp. SG63]
MGDSKFPRTWRQKAVLIPLVRALKLWYRPRVHGLEAIPRDRPLVYVAKHPRTWLYFETMLLGLLTFWDEDRIPFRPMEKRGTSLHRLPVTSWVRRHVGTIEATEEAALDALRGGESVLVFPGGGRELYGPPDRLDWKGRHGFARIAARAGAPVVPVAIAGADQQHPGRLRLGTRGSLWLPPVPLPVPLDLWFGAPLAPPSDEDAAAIAAFSGEAAVATQALLDAATAARRKPWSLT